MGSLRDFIALLDVAEVAPNRFAGTSDAGDRGIIDGSQVLGQSLVAASKTLPGRLVRSARATFLRTIAADRDLEFDVTVVKAGRLMAFADVRCHQGDRDCVRTQVVLDAPQPDFIRHSSSPAETTSPDNAIERDMPMEGRTLRLDGVVDENDPDEFGPPALRAWLHYDAIPDRDDVRKALLAHFTGHLGISTSLRAHRGVGTAQSHKTISTAPIVVSIAFHEPVEWTDWILYEHDSTFAGAGMSFVRGAIYASGRELIASFSQEAMIRGLEEHELRIDEAVRL